MDQLPNDVFTVIFDQLKVEELIHFCSTDKSFHQLCDDDLLWRRIYYTYYNNPDKKYLSDMGTYTIDVSYLRNRGISWFNIVKHSHKRLIERKKYFPYPYGNRKL